MTEIEYKREMNRNYMVIHPETGRSYKYTIRMLSGNQVPGLLPFQEKWINGNNRYYYDITSKQPLERILDYRNLKGEELRTFLSSFLLALREIERFLLDESQICLEPAFIYTEPENFRCSLTLVPGRYKDFTKGMQNLSQYLLDHVNQNDGEAVVLAFSVFKECQKENFGIEDIEKCLGNVGKGEAVADAAAKHKEETDSERFIPIPNKDVWQEKEEVWQELEEEHNKEISAKQMPAWFMAGVIAIMGLIPFGIFLLFGLNGLYRWKWCLAGAELLLFGVLVVSNRLEKEQENCEEDMKIPEKQESWEDYLRDSENFKFEERHTDETDESEEEMQTILLTASPGPQTCRTLVSVNDNLTVPIPYFPFLIGKNESLADFCLNEPGVSRIHMKIEQEKEQYYVTDLNSTNGTKVDGRLLNANETCELFLGSEVCIASVRFVFR